MKRLIEWLKKMWQDILYGTRLYSWPDRIPDEFIRHRVRCQECDEECDVVHVPPSHSSCADGFYCYPCEPDTMLQGWERRIIGRSEGAK